MSQNNTIRKSDKKFIRTQKARIRASVLDVKKQQEMIDEVYKKFLHQVKTEKVKEVSAEKAEEKAEVKKETKKKVVTSKK